MRSVRQSVLLSLIGLLQCAAALAQSPPAEIPGARQIREALGGLFGSRPAPAASAALQPAAPAPSAGQALLIQPNAAALNELAVDRECRKVEERFDVFAKAVDYGGTSAQLRLNQLVATNFEHSQLTAEDRLLLRYLAYTTIWVPIEVETTVGRLYAQISGASGSDLVGGSGNRSERKAMERLSQRLQELRELTPGFPGNVNLVLDPDLRDGAFARVGGIVVVSPRYLAQMDENDNVRDVVLAHELSHLYKRHTIKELQHQLITTAPGFSLAKKLLRRSDPQAGPSLIPNFIAYAQLGTELFSAIRATQLNYSREQELEADGCAIRWLEAMKIEPAKAWQVFGALLNDASADPTSSYSSLHPSPEERSANIANALRPPRATPPATPSQPVTPVQRGARPPATTNPAAPARPPRTP